jgi:hypothetical protein
MPITFACPECDKTFKVSDEMAGRKGKCNNCGATMLIPGKVGAMKSSNGTPRSRDDADDEDDRDYEDEPRSQVRRKRDDDDYDHEVVRSRRQDDDDFDDEREEEERPRRKKKRKKKKARSLMGLWVSLGILGTLAILSGTYFAVAALIGIWPFGGPGEAMKFMPDNCNLLISIKWDDVEKSQVFQDLKKNNPEIEKALNPQSQKGFGFWKVKNPDSILVGVSLSKTSFTSNTPPKATAAFSFKERVSEDDMLNSVENKSAFKEAKIGSFKVYDGPEWSFSVVSSKMIIVGEKEQVRAVLERNKHPEISEGLRAAMDKVNFSKGIAIAADLKGLASSSPKGPGGIPGGGQDPMAAFQKVGEEVEGLAAQISPGTDIGIECTLICKTAKGAEDIKKSAEGLSAMLGMFGAAVPKEAKEILDTLKATVAGNNVTITMNIKGSSITNLTNNPFMMGGGFGGPPAGGGLNQQPRPNNPGGIRPPTGPGNLNPQPGGPGGARPGRPGGGKRPGGPPG